jgi:serine/threonine-protein kinase
MPMLMPEERVGTLLGGRYRLESILGAGGTSTVFRARHTFTDRAVALKLLKPEHARDRGLVARFLKEARAASTVVHPHVVAILDMGTDDDCTYLAMELLQGESLAALLARQGALSEAQTVTLLRPLMEAIGVAHASGIVHRDVKPDNVLIGHRGDDVQRAVLLDFGMAKTTEVAWGHMTQSGVLVGTPYYMSPEQAEGAPDLGPQTDVWSTGVMLYRALSGELPFVGNTPTALLLAIARGEHRHLGERAPHLDPAIAAWVEGALVVDRAGRYENMAAMLDALERALRGDVSPVVSNAIGASPPPQRRRTTAIVAGLIAAAVLLACAAWATQGTSDAPAIPPRPEVRAEVAAPSTEVPTAPAEPTPEPLMATPNEPAIAPIAERAARPRRTRTAPSAETSDGAPRVRTPESGLVTEW